MHAQPAADDTIQDWTTRALNKVNRGYSGNGIVIGIQLNLFPELNI